MDFGTVLGSDSAETTGPPQGGRRGDDTPLAGAWGWGPREVETGGPLERRLVWVGEPLHHWPRWDGGSVSQKKMWGARDRGLVTSSQLPWPPRSRDTAWAQAGLHLPHIPQVALHTVGGTLVSAEGTMRPAPGRKAQPGHLSLAAKGPQGHCGVVMSSPEWPLLPQASSSFWILPRRATLVPEGGLLGEGSYLPSNPGNSVPLMPLLLREADPPSNWAWRGPDQDG